MASKNQVIVITGAGSGVGRDSARLFLDQGWKVALIGRRTRTLEETVQNRKEAICVKCDVSDFEEVKKGFSTIVNKFGRIDVLFNIFM